MAKKKKSRSQNVSANFIAYLAVLLGVQQWLAAIETSDHSAGGLGSIVRFLIIMAIAFFAIKSFTPYSSLIRKSTGTGHMAQGLLAATALLNIYALWVGFLQTVPVIKAIVDLGAAWLILVPALGIPALLIYYGNKLYSRLDDWEKFVFTIIGLPFALLTYLWATGKMTISGSTLPSVVAVLASPSAPYFSVLLIGVAVGAATGAIVGIVHPVSKHFVDDIVEFVVSKIKGKRKV